MLDRVHKIADIVAAFAVVGSLIFVGIQLRQNTNAMGIQNRLSAMKAWNDPVLALATNKQLADEWNEGRYPAFKTKGTAAIDNASLQLIAHFSVVMKSTEGQYLQYLDGNLSEEVWNGMRNSLISHITLREFFVGYWRVNRNIHSPRFQLLVEELIPIAAERRQQIADRVGYVETE